MPSPLYQNEAQAAQGLNLLTSAGTSAWKTAKETINRRHPELSEPAKWALIRTLFTQLGGQLTAPERRLESAEPSSFGGQMPLLNESRPSVRSRAIND